MKTPRTDAEEKLILIDCDDSCVDIYVRRDGKLHEGGLITSDFARQLERELITVKALADSLAEAIAHSPYDESLAEALAAYENHKKPTP